MTPTVKESTVPFLHAFPQFPEIRAGFSLRMGGQSSEPYSSLNLSFHNGDDEQSVRTNWNSLLLGEGFKWKHLRLVRQKHTNEFLHAKVWDPIHPPEADAIWTKRGGNFLAVLGADCLPILIYCQKPSIIAAAHAGWQGTQKEILAKLLEHLQKNAGLDPAHTYVAMGPCIQPCHYEVGPEFRKLFSEEFLDYRGGQLYLSLQKANTHQAISLGVPQNHIFAFPHCTYCHPALFFSHRRDKEPTGRNAAWIALAPTK